MQKGTFVMQEKHSEPTAAMISWRDVLKVHPAADLFPLVSTDELKALGEDIKKNGLRNRIAVIDGPDDEPILIDGRNRLDAMELVGLEIVLENVAMLACCRKHSPGFDPYAYVISANIHRRHLTAEQQRDLIAKLLKANPEKSNRQVAKLTGVSHPHVAKVRTELEQTGDVETVSTSIDTRGRKQPAKRRRTEDDFAKDIAARQAAVPGTQAQPSNPITAAWDEGSHAQRVEFVRHRAEHLERAAGAGSRVRSRKQSTDIEEAFKEWYQHYPRHVAPRAALKAYKQALSRGATVEQLKLSVMRYAAECTGRDPQYIKHPATWLNGSCWEDEPAPAASSSEISRRTTRRGNSMAEIARGGT
jgi:ParB-like chromosome segregation protein Spo0J